MSDFDLNVNKISGNGDVKVVTEAPRLEDDADIYDLRRQMEARQVVKDYLRAEILRLQKLMEDMTREIISIDLKLRDRKPVGEPRNQRRLYAPGSQPAPLDDEGGHVDTEIIDA
jgi:hypothetical protein